MQDTPSTMRAIAISAPGGPDVLRPITLPTPAPKSGEVLIRIRAAGVNRPDLLQRMGKYPPPVGASDIPGLEVAGEIAAIGPDTICPHPVGTGVCALLTGGGYAEYATAPVGQILHIPSALTYEQAAALPECVFTVWQNVFRLGHLQAGGSILIHGGASGIGTTAIQMARHMDSGRIFVTVGSDEKGTACIELGATEAINYKKMDFVAETLRATEHIGVDVVLDMVGGDYVARNLQVLKYGGRHVTIAMLNGAQATIDLRTLMQKNLIMTGSTLRPRSPAEKQVLRDEIMDKIWPGVEAGAITPVIHKIFALDDAAAAHTELERGQHIGKIVLKTPD